MKDVLLVHGGHPNFLAHIAAAQAAGHRIVVVDDNTTPEKLHETLRGLTQHVVHIDDAPALPDPAAFKNDLSIARPARAAHHSDWNHPYPPPRRQKRK